MVQLDAGTSNNEVSMRSVILVGVLESYVNQSSFVSNNWRLENPIPG